MHHSPLYHSLLRNRILLFVTHILAVTRAMTGSMTAPCLLLTLAWCISFCFLGVRTAHEVLKLRPEGLDRAEFISNLRLSASLSHYIWTYAQS